MSTSSSVASSDPSSSFLRSAPQGRACSQRKLTANRANSQKSTGPKSPQGKSRSSRNATTLGLYSSHNVLPCEDPALFHRVPQGLPRRPPSPKPPPSSSWSIASSLPPGNFAASRPPNTSSTSPNKAISTPPSKTPSKPIKKPKNATTTPHRTLRPPKRPQTPAQTSSFLEQHPHPFRHHPRPYALPQRRLRPGPPPPPRTTLRSRSIHRSLKELRTLRKSRPNSEDLPQHPYLDNETRTQLLTPTSHRNIKTSKTNPPKTNPPPPPPRLAVVASATTQPSPDNKNGENKPTEQTDPTPPLSSFIRHPSILQLKSNSLPRHVPPRRECEAAPCPIANPPTTETSRIIIHPQHMRPV